MADTPKRIAYVQAREDGLPYSIHGMAAAKGFAFLGYNVQFFQRPELPTLPLTRDTVVAGGMGTVREALQQLGIDPPILSSAPAILHPYLGRECWRTTIGAVREARRYPVFVKPYDQAKVFSGLVLKNREDLERLLAPREGFPPLGDDFPLLAQSPVTFLSEWRAFVIRSAVIGLNFYQGDPLALPSPAVIKLAIAAHHHAPAGYSADFGVTDDGRTLLIEINDGYSLGHGALTSNLYAELLEARWLEMTAS